MEDLQIAIADGDVKKVGLRTRADLRRYNNILIKLLQCQPTDSFCIHFSKWNCSSRVVNTLTSL